MEARMLMLAPNNLFSPASGKPITTPSQDIVLGCYYLTQEPRKARKEGERFSVFGDHHEVEFAFSEKAIKVHDRIWLKNPDFGRQTVFGNSEKNYIETTVGPRDLQHDLATERRFLQQDLRQEAALRRHLPHQSRCRSTTRPSRLSIS
jgi:DNA-directed RNA polymerase beta' subunit